MPYSPPAGNAVNFVRDRAAYSPPPGNHVDFHGYTEAYYVAIGNGKVILAGAMETYSSPVGLASGSLDFAGSSTAGHGVSAGGFGGILLGGVIDTEVVIPTINAIGQVSWAGQIDVTVVVNSLCSGGIPWAGGIDLFTRPPQIDAECYGVLPAFGGSAETRRGENAAGAGRLSFGGQAAARAGRTGAMAGRLVLAGTAQARRGENADMAGSIVFSGEAHARTDRAVIAALAGAVIMAGRAIASTDHDVPVSLDTTFVLTGHEVVYVFQ